MAIVHLLCDFLIQRTSFRIGSRFLVIKKKQSTALLIPLFPPQLKNGNIPFKQQTMGQPLLKIWMRIR